MATLFYGVMGEGRGHAARARAMVEAMRPRHKIVLYTSHDALAFLNDLYATAEDVEIRPIEGLKFHYKQGRLDLRRTIKAGLAVWRNLDGLLKPLLDDIDREGPDLVISDFEPLVARAAHKRNVPVLSLDHQHFLLAYDLSRLPWRLRMLGRSMRLAVWAFGIGQQKTVVSAFYRPPLKRGYEDVVQVGPLLRPGIRGIAPSIDGYLLSYLRPATPARVVDLLEQLGRPIKIFGLGQRSPRGGLTFHEVDDRQFTAALAGCEAVVAAAGNQLLGESLYLGKPYFALPEEKHFEQCINAHFLREMGAGDWRPIEAVTLADLQSFFDRLGEFRANLTGRREEFDGTPAAVQAIEEMLAKVGRDRDEAQNAGPKRSTTPAGQPGLAPG